MKETKEVRKRASGPEAAPYMGYARKLLGQMKNQMQLGRLLQLRWVKKLQDGTIVMVSSIFGQDTVDIFVPVTGGKQRKKVMKKTSVQDFVMAGSAFIAGPDFDVRRAFIWTGPGTMRNLGSLGDASSQSEAWGISGDGDTVVGYCTSTEFTDPRAFKWTEGSGMEYILGATSYAYAASGDGSVIVGDYYPVAESRAYRWTEAGGVELLAGNSSFARGVSEDGDVVVGSMFTGVDTRAFRWTAEGGAEDILGRDSSALAVSADGLTVVGVCDLLPYKWTAQNGLEFLDLMGHITGSANGVSEDGSVIVGLVRDTFGQTKAVQWTAQEVVEIATIGGGSNIANAVSYDGAFVVGRVDSPTNGFVMAFVTEDGGTPVLAERIGATKSGYDSATAYAVAAPVQEFTKERDAP